MYTFYDINGNVIGIESDYIAELKPNQTWSFDVQYFGNYDKIASYEFSEIIGD